MLRDLEPTQRDDPFDQGSLHLPHASEFKFCLRTGLDHAAIAQLKSNWVRSAKTPSWATIRLGSFCKKAR